LNITATGLRRVWRGWMGEPSSVVGIAYSSYGIRYSKLELKGFNG